jgi:phosphatidylglycerol lysyltransferase
LLKRHGWNSTSFQILEPGFRYWWLDDEACVGYVDTGSAWVAAAPVAAPDRLAEVSAGFLAAADANHRRASCFGTESRFHDATGWEALRVGDQPIWAPEDWTGVVQATRSLREQLRRARAKGVTVRAVDPAETAAGTPLRIQIDTLIARWISSRPLAPMAFLVQVDPFTHPEERRYFVAEREGRVIAFLGVIPIYARSGWFFEDFLRDPAAPNGTIELLVDAGMRAAVAEQVPHVTLGLVPLAGEVSSWLRAARRMGRALYDFDGLRAFKAKFKPRGWDPIFLAYPPGRSASVALFDTLTAFARGGLLRFGIQTLLRGPAIVVRVLALLLLVWTVLLALPMNSGLFPSPAVQYGWVGFDVALGAALLALAHRWRPPLADVVAVAVTGDAILTAAQAVLYNLPRCHGVVDAIVISVAVLAPTGAAVLLWNARAFRAPQPADLATT